MNLQHILLQMVEEFGTDVADGISARFKALETTTDEVVPAVPDEDVLVVDRELFDRIETRLGDLELAEQARIEAKAKMAKARAAKKAK